MRRHTSTLDGELVQIEEVPNPVITHPQDVIVRITGAGVCRTELHILSGDLTPDLPHILGHENGGVVQEVGDGVTTVKPGDPVLCYPFLSAGLSAEERRALDSAAPDRVTPGIDAQGGFAELLKTNERAVLPLPPGTDPARLAPLTDAGLAAYRACRKASLAPGDTAIVLGLGGLGHLAVQILAATTPARIIGVDPRIEARELGTACGAHDVGPFEMLADWEGSATAVLDFVGSSDTIAGAIAALGFGGHLLAVGVGGDVSLPIFDLVTTEKRIEGVYVGTYQDLVEVTELALAGTVNPAVTFYQLSDADRALHDLANGTVVGRAVLQP